MFSLNATANMPPNLKEEASVRVYKQIQENPILLLWLLRINNVAVKTYTTEILLTWFNDIRILKH